MARESVKVVGRESPIASKVGCAPQTLIEWGKKFMGIERTTVLIAADGTIAQVWAKVKVPGHVEAVLEAVRGL